MYRIQSEPKYWWPVVVKLPDPSKPGQMAEHRFEAEYRWLDDANHKALIAESIEKALSVTDAVSRVCVGFRHVEHEDGSPMQSSTEALGVLMRAQGVAAALWHAYLDSRAKAAEKN